jgi:hypothetical protein
MEGGHDHLFSDYCLSLGLMEAMNWHPILGALLCKYWRTDLPPTNATPSRTEPSSSQTSYGSTAPLPIMLLYEVETYYASSNLGRQDESARGLDRMGISPQVLSHYKHRNI